MNELLDICNHSLVAQDCPLNDAALSMRLLGPCWVGPVWMVGTCILRDRETTSHGRTIQVGTFDHNLSGRR